MRRLGNFCRTAMLEERLNGLALMNFHLDRNPEGKKVIDKYRRQNDPTERQKTGTSSLRTRKLLQGFPPIFHLSNDSYALRYQIHHRKFH